MSCDKWELGWAALIDVIKFGRSYQLSCGEFTHKIIVHAASNDNFQKKLSSSAACVQLKAGLEICHFWLARNQFYSQKLAFRCILPHPHLSSVQHLTTSTSSFMQHPHPVLHSSPSWILPRPRPRLPQHLSQLLAKSHQNRSHFEALPLRLRATLYSWSTPDIISRHVVLRWFFICVRR